MLQNCFFILLIDFRGGKRNTHFLLHLLMHSLTDSFLCPDQMNPQLGCMGTTLQPAELQRQDYAKGVFKNYSVRRDTGRRGSIHHPSLAC